MFEYYPLVKKECVVKQILHDLLDRLYVGSLQGMISYLRKNRYVTTGEFKELSELCA